MGVSDSELNDEDVIDDVKTSNTFSTLLIPVETIDVETKPKDNETKTWAFRLILLYVKITLFSTTNSVISGMKNSKIFVV